MHIRRELRSLPAQTLMLRLLQGVLAGNGKGRGQGRLAAEGLVTQLVAAWCDELMHTPRIHSPPDV